MQNKIIHKQFNLGSTPLKLKKNKTKKNNKSLLVKLQIHNLLFETPLICVFIHANDYNIS